MGTSDDSLVAHPLENPRLGSEGSLERGLRALHQVGTGKSREFKYTAVRIASRTIFDEKPSRR